MGWSGAVSVGRRGRSRIGDSSLQMNSPSGPVAKQDLKELPHRNSAIRRQKSPAGNNRVAATEMNYRSDVSFRQACVTAAGPTDNSEKIASGYPVIPVANGFGGGVVGVDCARRRLRTPLRIWSLLAIRRCLRFALR
jgi:hypothetical protein